MADLILAGYVMPLGAKYMVIFDHAGPASYNNTGTYATSGGTITANTSGLNLGGFDALIATSDSQDGLYYAVLIPTSGGNGNAIVSYAIHWFVRATNVEVANATNISTSYIRMLAVMV